MTQPPYPPDQEPARADGGAQPGCWWHPGKPTGLSCVRCGRPACPDCLREASVGYQCIDCVEAARAQQRRPQPLRPGDRTVAGARVSSKNVVTPLLIAVNVLVYVVTAAQAGDPMNNQDSALLNGGSLWPLGIHVHGEWLRLVASGFLHYGLLHLAMNMLALWILGKDLELLLGKVRFLALYLVSLLGGSTAVFLLGDVNVGTAGASGAVYGLMGALLVAVLRLKLNPGGAIGIIAINLVLTVTIPGISLLGHLGGLVAGALVMVAMLYGPKKDRTAYQATVVALLVAAFVGLIIYRDSTIASDICRTYPALCAGTTV
ncbi:MULTISPECIES: rhomboid family intramembrane serine protease [Prauserella salsuginis group]|uniref:Membrane associated rhomboid family serine protease n=2 Tax=Prauserella salsuginis group TaxID=2893672 RepID=A0A839XJF4_9PSEU|nr:MULTISPECIES: rhomboid family intramembrane serine protease [Prauserella salsuginis group]MBB3662667.1 membrane associated rhomboid family serine protease [Prauserella sediminis]MCR3720365.1 Membrane associated serine protease, rhomboid family [Prauserella flava]MCR3733926.1 Membrane associated serine protease, rhomboid family [Prauserella salsuginis]